MPRTKTFKSSNEKLVRLRQVIKQTNDMHEEDPIEMDDFEPTGEALPKAWYGSNEVIIEEQSMFSKLMDGDIIYEPPAIKTRHEVLSKYITEK